MVKKTIPEFNLIGHRLLNQKGYSIPKNQLDSVQERWIRENMTVKPIALPQYDMGINPFPVYYESKERLYLPRDWAIKTFGPPDKDTRKEGLSLREDVVFGGILREEQKPIVNTFMGSDANGLLCVPCGYGKTFMAIWIALELKKRFLVVVHKEFLLSQWRGELERLVPGIKIGILQGPLCQIGPEYDCVLVMIQTLCQRDLSGDSFDTFGFAIFDECHHLGAEYFSKSLIKIQCKHMLGLSATPDRTDGLTKVFIWFLGPIVYRIKHREADESVQVMLYRFESTDVTYTKVPLNYRGEVIRARLLNQIAGFKPRTEYLSSKVIEYAKEGRKILILSDRRGHLEDFENEIKTGGVTDIGYYVGGMKQALLDKSEKCAIILGTFAMASEAMNIPSLNTILLATPKSNIEQSVGRILREKREVRKFPPIIMDILDSQHIGCVGQCNKRKKYYKDCGYKINLIEFGKEPTILKEEEEEPLEKKDQCIILAD